MKLMFDIGANAGDIALHFSRFTDKVVAFEPNPNLVQALKKKFDNTNVVIDSRGISDSIGTKELKICNAPTLSSFSNDWINNSRFSDDHYWAISVLVNICTLDSIIDQYGIPDFIKIDVEGHEKEVLQGLSKLLLNTVICFEWVEEHWEKVLDTVTHLQVLGYNNFHLTDGDGLLLNENINWSTWNTLDTNNILPHRKERWGMIYFKFA